MGRPFSAVLKLGPAPDYKIDFDFGERPERETVDLEELRKTDPVGKCPVCGKNVYETENAYVCEDHLDPNAKEEVHFPQLESHSAAADKPRRDEQTAFHRIHRSASRLCV